jgi:DNA-binding NtrC family response regulator
LKETTAVFKGTAEALIGVGTAIRAIEAEIDYAARSDAKVLITGESGVGKEVTARLVHQRSRRARTPLVTINCAGIPDSLLESALFGHVKGSFTGARREDIPMFVEHFLRLYAERHTVQPPAMTPEVMTRLLDYDWPGTVRELRHVVERLIVRSHSGIITPDQLSPEMLPPAPLRPLTPAKSGRTASLVDELYERLVDGGESFWCSYSCSICRSATTRGF